MATMPLRRLKALHINDVNNSPRLLKEAGRSIAASLARLFNLSIQQGVFPAIWKLANVLPIFKKGDPSTTSNYRPVSLLSRIATIFERIIFKHMFNHFRQNFLISIWQSGFLPGSSTVTQLVELYDQFCKALNERKALKIIFLDISKALIRYGTKVYCTQWKKQAYTIDSTNG